jgi:hypothetical protein
MLEVIDKFDQEDGDPRLDDESQENGGAVSIKSDQQRSFENETTDRFLSPGPQGTQHLQRDGSENVSIEAAAPWRRSWINRPSPMLVMRVIVLDGEVEVENAQQIKASEPPTQ